MATSNLAPDFLQLADDIYRCRTCRETWPTFANEVKDPNRHPEMAHGSASPKILIVSINPKFDESRAIEPDLASFVARATSPASVIEENAFDQALAKALPAGYGIKHGNATNTRVYKCATANEAKVKGVASTCADRFLARELKVMSPLVVLAMGKSAWPETFRVLNAGSAPAGPGPHKASGDVDGRRVPIVACWHLTGNVQARLDAYRFAVRQLVSDAMGLTSGNGSELSRSFEDKLGTARAGLFAITHNDREYGGHDADTRSDRGAGLSSLRPHWGTDRGTK